MVAKSKRREIQQQQLIESKNSIVSRWQNFRARLRRLYGPGVESRLVYLDQRWYEIRSCGWNPEDSEIWDWWAHLDWPIRIRLILMSRRCGMYAQNRKLWKNPSLSSPLHDGGHASAH